MASLISNGMDGRDVGQDFLDCLEAMQSNQQLPMSAVFEQGLPKQSPKAGIEAAIVQRAQAAHEGISSVFVDTVTSLQRPTHSAHVCPCITPTHPIYSTALERYLTQKDLMHCQGFWASCLSPETYKSLQDDSKRGQDMIGNSFSTTVFQAVLLSSMASATAAWNAIQAKPVLSDGGEQGPAQRLPLRRVTGKRPAPAYEFANILKNKKVKAPRANKTKRSKYCRKRKGIDSRKHNKGKKTEATLWEKEQLTLLVEFNQYHFPLLCQIVFHFTWSPGLAF